LSFIDEMQNNASDGGVDAPTGATLRAEPTTSMT
jgi:hypothetical protein